MLDHAGYACLSTSPTWLIRNGPTSSIVIFLFFESIKNYFKSMLMNKNAYNNYKVDDEFVEYFLKMFIKKYSSVYYLINLFKK